jgi:hypothetical protein
MGKIFKLPILGRFVTRSPIVADRHGSATRAKDVFGGSAYETNLSVKVIDKDGNERKIKDYFGSTPWDRFKNKLLYRNQTKLNLHSGLVTNVGVLGIANDWNVAAPSGAAINTLKLANWHHTGIGTTAAAATDIALQTISVQGGQTPVAGAQSTISAANLQKYQTVATISYTGSEAVTEWGLICGSTVSSATGSPFTATSSTAATVTGTPLTASSTTVQGQQQRIVVAGTTTVWGFITSNTTSVLNIPAWYTVAGGLAGSTPGTTETFITRPIMWDHKVFGAINVVNGDSIQFTYTLTVNSGG